MARPMFRMVLLYAIALAAAAFVLEWLQFKYFAQSYSVEIYVVLIALAFAALGIWVGHRLTAKKPRGPFERNDTALKSLGISRRDCDRWAFRDGNWRCGKPWRMASRTRKSPARSLSRPTRSRPISLASMQNWRSMAGCRR